MNKVKFNSYLPPNLDTEKNLPYIISQVRSGLSKIGHFEFQGKLFDPKTTHLFLKMITLNRNVSTVVEFPAWVLEIRYLLARK